MTSLLSVAQASKSFAGLSAVRDISFDVAPGEIFGIAGPNGAGKTTLFNLITGVPYHADSGSIRFDGKDITRLPPHRIYRAGIGRTFQKESGFDSLTVHQNVRVAAAFGGVPRSSRSQAVEAVLDSVGLGNEGSSAARTLPLYAKKRLMLASALVIEPKLLMLDEPGGGLSGTELDEFKILLSSINKKGITIVLIEHVLPLLFGICHRLIIMDYGDKIAEGKPEEMARSEVVIEAYLGERGMDAFHALGG